MYKALLVLAVLLLVVPGSSLAKMYEEPTSFSLQDKSLQQVDRKVMEAIDPERLRAADRERGKVPERPAPLRFAVSREVAFDLDNSGSWRDAPGGRLWRLVIESPGALSLNLGFTRFNLPEGAKLWVYDPARSQVNGPYTAADRSRHGRLWTPIIEGPVTVVELFVPEGAPRPAVAIGQVNQGYRDVAKGDPADKQGSCNNDVICPVGDPWRNQIRSVARYTIDGMYLCSGQLVNNTALDFTPYFLSANHCGVSAANDDTLVFYWNYEAPNCGDLGGGSLADNQSGSIYRASYAPSDFLLVELSSDPDPSYNVFFSGWDATGTAAASTVGIHHPSGAVKAISFNTDAVTSTAYLGTTVDATQNHWRVDDWEDGTTEGGSSGSCLWDAASKRCIGQLHGGYASCAAPTSSDWYGKLSVSWNGGGTNATQLRHWLDPVPTGALTLDGDPHITTLDGTHYDFQGAGEFVALRDPTGTEIQVRQAPIATTFFPGPNPYHGLATCVSLNTAVAARVNGRRVTYQPNLSGVPDPSGLQLRVDGSLVQLGANGIDLGAGARIDGTAAPGGLKITFPDRYILLVTPGWWASQGKWYLNVGVVQNPSVSGLGGVAVEDAGPAGTGGLGGPIADGSWLPALPDGSSVGPIPTSLHDRYVVLYDQFGDAWRVTGATSLFDYGPGTSTDTFTLASWPKQEPPCELPEAPVAEPLPERIAQRLCRPITDETRRANCVFDVRVTGERGFADTYLLTQEVERDETPAVVTGDGGDGGDGGTGGPTGGGPGTGEIPAFVRRGLAGSFHVGSAHPVGSFDDPVDSNVHFRLDLGYPLTDRIRLLAMAGYSQFTAEIATALDHPRWINLSVNAQVLFPTTSGLRWYLEGGPGAYWPESGSNEAGFNLGFGAQIPLGTGPFTLEWGADYHRVQADEHQDFVTVQLGVLFR